MVQWNPEILDKLIAPGVSRFTDARVPDVGREFPEAEHWLANHFLNRCCAHGTRTLIVRLPWRLCAEFRTL
jgi:hypothetical protein